MFQKVVLVLCIVGIATAQEGFKDCLQQDSISCVQLAIYRKAREFFDSPKIELLGGLSFIKPTGRDARSSNVDGTLVESANDVEQRENALEGFVTDGAKSFFAERSLNLDMAAAARSLSGAIPEEVKSSVRSMVSEARGKKKKILKALLPILGLVKLKVAALAVIALFGIALIAKKALVISIIALILSKFLLIKKLLSKGKGDGAAAGGLLDAFDSLGAHSQPIGQQLAYSGHKQY
ncbi:unnamed protein product [Chironomus riparius]|uniref:Osiris 6 n=1 Tax=Chironomus riparius TaxID=315576 RepID=A0A9N9S0F4_9DIPT|nr:unnamed protein product [Chironomus riparius]